MSYPCRMPRFLVCTGIQTNKNVKIYPEVNDIILQDWRIISGGMNWGSYEPITDNVNFDVFIQKYAAGHIGMSILG